MAAPSGRWRPTSCGSMNEAGCWLVSLANVLRHLRVDVDGNWHVRESAVEALVDIGTERALALFENSLRDTEPEVVRHALERLVQARSPAGLTTMVKVMETRGSDVLGKTWNLKLLKEPRREPARGLDTF